MRWKCTVAYEGSSFDGWQAQRSGNTVQQVLEKRLSFLFDRAVRIQGSGRTDSGVHARGQVFHFDGDWSHGPTDLINALKTGIPETIRVYEAEIVEDAFHARFSTIGKCYIYRFYEGDALPFETRYCLSLGKRRVDLEAMNAAAQVLIGKHDFTAFGANGRDDKPRDPVKDLRVLEVTREGPRLTLRTEGSGYLYKMVRRLAGCLLDVGLGKLSVDEVAAIRASAKPSRVIVTAPARGLSLEWVKYD
jgi:tRNA pseudouridine38-40 synthase|tara:strand:- start:391 stop:1131 length:741 start_codon:yes stop_codon:yes gene_type:complete